MSDDANYQPVTDQLPAKLGTGGGAAAGLPGWGEYLNSGYTGGSNEFLANLQKYDPNAHYENGITYGGEGGGGGDAQMVLKYDATKLPGGGPPGVDMNKGGFAGIGGSPDAQYRGNLFNDQDIRHDDFWGDYTPRGNLNTAKDDKNIVDIIGPLIVGAATMGAGYLGVAPALAASGMDAAGSAAFAAGGSGAVGGAGAGAVGSAGAGAANYAGTSASNSLVGRGVSNLPRAGQTYESATNPQAQYTPEQVAYIISSLRNRYNTQTASGP